jgi:hypothetical protein
MIAMALLLLTVTHPPPVQSVGSLTLLEGSLKLVRGTTVYQGIEGMNLKQGDLIESSDGAFAQLEFASGAVVAVGPTTRLYILPSAVAGMSNGKTLSLDIVVLNGWLKSEAPAGKSLYRYRTALLATVTPGGTVVVRSAGNACDIFVESGVASVGEVNQNGNAASLTLAKVGQFFSRQKATGVTTAARPSAAFLESMPKPFRDTLPARLARLSDSTVEPKVGRSVNYEDIEYWLVMPAGWRRGLADRFSTRLADSTFRKQIESHLGEFPEWEPILYPTNSSESPQMRN